MFVGIVTGNVCFVLCEIVITCNSSAFVRGTTAFFFGVETEEEDGDKGGGCK
jgi:hypothetical protein